MLYQNKGAAQAGIVYHPTDMNHDLVGLTWEYNGLTYYCVTHPFFKYSAIVMGFNRPVVPIDSGIIQSSTVYVYY
jgi:hypothetical protein